ncbi:F-box/LRR-repeat protein 17 [Rhinophrynus dorsalis]
MGGLFCKQRSGQSRGDSRKKQQCGDCFLRGPCMLCFIVHSDQQDHQYTLCSEQGQSREREQYRLASPDLPAARSAAQDCARLLLLCPGELRDWEERSRSLLCTGLLRGPGLLRASTSQRSADMVCKRKSCGGSQQPCTPCKQPRCAPSEEAQMAHQATEEEQAVDQSVEEEQALDPASNKQQVIDLSPEEKQTVGYTAKEGQIAPHTCIEEQGLTHTVRKEGTTDYAVGEELTKHTVEKNHTTHHDFEEEPSCSSLPCLTLCSNTENSLVCTQLTTSSPESGSRAEDAPTEIVGIFEPLHINQLPSSLLLKIFSNLSLNERCFSASLVCKYWRDLCLDFQFWKQLDLSNRQQVKDYLLERIACRSQNITELNISDCHNVSDEGVCMVAQNCHGLLKYTAYRCKQLSDISVIALASHCPSLQKVHVGNQDRLTDEALKQLGTKCRELNDIHFGQCYKITDQGMISIAKGSPKLQKIYMQENKLVSDESVKAFAENCPELQYVGFMGCSVTSEGVIHLTKLKNLISLDLRQITELDNETVMEVVKKCRNLTSLNLCLNRSINDRCVEMIAKEGRKLKELYLVTCKITDYALIAIGRYSMTIETVDVGWCKEITDQGATLIAQSSKSIRYLGLMRCDKVNEATVEQLVQQYPLITFSTVLQDCKRTLERAYQMGWTPSASSVS